MTQLLEQVKQRRLAAGISQYKLAELTGIKQPHIARFESGTHKVSLATLERICNALGCRLTIEDK